MSSRQLAVKAVLQYPEGLELGCSPDIKRFKLPRESADDKRDLYCRLVDTLPTIFPDITGVDFSLYWKDAEGDLVQFSTSGELQTAIDAMSDHVLRIYVIVHFDEIEDTTDTEVQSESEKSSKRVRFARAGRRFRRRLRRRRRTALSDPGVISKEYRIGARLLIRHLHGADKDGEDQSSQLGGTPLVQLAPEVRDFIQQIHEEWHSKLATQRPTVVSRRMRMKQRTLPPGLERDHFLWLLRLMGRWHRRHAGLCRAASGWSSGDTDADESGGEETLLKTVRRRRKKQKRAHRDAKKGKTPEGDGEKEEEEKVSSDQQNVTREFRQAVRLIMRKVHNKKDSKPADDQEKATLTALKPEVHSFIQKVADDWHAMLGEKKPILVAKRMKKRKKGLPADIQRDHYLWLCRYFRRWHSRHAALCPVMAGWSSGEEDYVSDDEEDTKMKGKKSKSSSSSSSSESDSDGDKKKKKAVPKEFVKATRILVRRFHKGKTTVCKEDKPSSEEEATLAALSPEVQASVQSFVEEWDNKLESKSPLLVAKRMRKKKTTDLPPGLGVGQVQFLCRFLSRWHCKHAAFCGSMGAWSSGDTGGETSGEERSCLRRRARMTGMLEVSTASEQEDTDCVESACEPVSKEFREGVRHWINQQHKKPADGSQKQDKQPKAKDDKKVTLSPEIQQFLRHFSEEWHSKLPSRRPRGVSREMKAQDRSASLPARMEREQYIWLCCYMARWHRKHSARCDVMSRGEMTVQG